MGVYFPNVLKIDSKFPDILKMGRLQFSKCLQSWFFKISRIKPRRKFPHVSSTSSGSMVAAGLCLSPTARRLHAGLCAGSMSDFVVLG